MTFLNPLVLFGLFAASIPVILHLLNLRKLRTIEFSTLTFLKELQRTKIRRLKLRRILLLIVRTLLVVMVILAFARPALRGTMLGTLGANAHSTVVFILDDSFSMTAADEHGELFKQAKDAANKLIDLLTEGDEAYLIKLSDLPAATVDPATHDFRALRTLINEATTSDVRNPLEDGIRLAAKLLQRSSNANKELYIISDMQETLFGERRQGAERDTLRLFDRASRFFLLPIGTKPAPNVSIDSVDLRTVLLEKDKAASLYVSIRNFSAVPLRSYVLGAYLDGQKSAQGSLSVEPWGSASTILNITPKRSGFIPGYVDLESDAIEADNRRYFTLHIPERISVAVIAGTAGEETYPLQVLRAGSGGQLAIQTLGSDKLPSADLKAIDVLVLTGIPSFGSAEAERIRHFLERGGGVVLFPGSRIVPENYNTTLLGPLGIPPIQVLLGGPNDSANLTIRRVDIDHPLFSTVFESSLPRARNTGRQFESPSIARALKRQSGARGRTVMELSDGSAFLSEHTVGNGKILFFSVAPTLDWSDFPFKGLFAPIIYRSVLYVSPGEEGSTSYLAGAEPVVRVPDRGLVGRDVTSGSAGPGPYALVGPDGVSEVVQPATVPGLGEGMLPSLTFSLHRLAVPGVYQLKAGGSTIAMFPVNPDSRESDTRRVTASSGREFWSRLGIPATSMETIAPGTQVRAAILQSRFGVELWKYCVVLALIMALAEMLIARDSRSGPPEAG